MAGEYAGIKLLNETRSNAQTCAAGSPDFLGAGVQILVLGYWHEDASYTASCAITAKRRNN